uniref:Tachykinin-related peptide 7 n=1 Tax=Rhodnius prolixus TaxID=13249 RepID=TRP7_RHOPR|nr:RecName: Full=Tachykinin-related peptide 7; Short=Rhopr-TRP-7 [Rhodnius prolixus]
SPATMGFAGVR